MASLTLRADDDESIIYEDVDITPLVKYFSKNVRVLNKESKIFHWDSSGRSGSGEVRLNDLRSMAKIFWDSYGDFSEGSYFGDGLYFSIDPIYTNNYGISINPWSLLVLNLPKKLKILDFVNARVWIDFATTDSDLLPVVKILKSFNCNPFSSAIELFYSMGPDQPLSCRNLIKKVYKDILGVQLIAYSYGQARNYSCYSPTFYANLAFILIDSKWIKKGMFQFYNRDYLANESERIEIQSLYLYKSIDQLVLEPEKQSNIKNKISTYLIQNIEMNFEKSLVECKEANCELKVEFCNIDKNNCELITLTSYVKNDELKITSDAAHEMKNNYLHDFSNYLLWPDLEGKPRSKNTPQWVKDNIFGCSGELPYEPQNP